MTVQRTEARSLLAQVFSLLVSLLVIPLLASSLAAPPHSEPPARRLPASCITSDGSVRYFAFGSNLGAEKLRNRGANGTEIKWSSRRAAVARGYRLAFNMRMFPPLEPAMASIEPLGATDGAAARRFGRYRRGKPPVVHARSIRCAAEATALRELADLYVAAAGIGADHFGAAVAPAFAATRDALVPPPGATCLPFEEAALCFS